MIGQKSLINYIDNMKELPKCILLQGIRGSDTHSVANYIKDKYPNHQLGIIDTLDVETFKLINIEAEQTITPLIIYIDNLDLSSVQCQNIVLKELETENNLVHFILGCSNKENIISTIVTRSVTLKMLPYTKQDMELYKIKYHIKNNIDLSIIETPKELQYCDTIYDKMETVINTANALVSKLPIVNTSNALKVTKIILDLDTNPMLITIFTHILQKEIMGSDYFSTGQKIKMEYMLERTLQELNNNIITPSSALDTLIINLTYTIM